jgi:hypothetical protein
VSITFYKNRLDLDNLTLTWSLSFILFFLFVLKRNKFLSIHSLSARQKTPIMHFPKIAFLLLPFILSAVIAAPTMDNAEAPAQGGILSVKRGFGCPNDYACSEHVSFTKCLFRALAPHKFFYFSFPLLSALFLTPVFQCRSLGGGRKGGYCKWQM